MIPPEDYDVDLDDKVLMISIALDKNGDLVYQIDREGTDERPPLSPQELMNLIVGLNTVQENISHGVIAHMLQSQRDEEQGEYKVEDDLE